MNYSGWKLGREGNVRGISLSLGSVPISRVGTYPEWQKMTGNYLL